MNYVTLCGDFSARVFGTYVFFVNDKQLKKVIRKLEEDATNVLKFMASNGLVANPSKTTLLVLNSKGETELEIKVGESTVKQQHQAKLLGVKIQNDQKWKTQIEGVVSSLKTLLNQTTPKPY